MDTADLELCLFICRQIKPRFNSIPHFNCIISPRHVCSRNIFSIFKDIESFQIAEIIIKVIRNYTVQYITVCFSY